MKTAQVISPVAFGPGVRLSLQEGQAARRPQALKKLGNGLYEVTAEVQFKAGETIGIEGDVPKALLASLDFKVSNKPVVAKAQAAPVV
jgi:hypothetical protein